MCLFLKSENNFCAKYFENHQTGKKVLSYPSLTFFSDFLWRWSNFSGLLGSITKTADVSECPGKCLHALASLLCEEVREDIQCPAQSMRCCVDRGQGNKPPPPPNPNDLATSESRPETSTKRAQTPRTTKSTTTTTTTTTRGRPAVASDKQDKFGDYEYVDSASDNGNILTSDSASRFTSMTTTTTSAFLVCTVHFFLR